jgi:hypothetical protein
MKEAKTLLLEFLAVVTHGQDAAALFAEDGALELPFLHSVGILGATGVARRPASSKTARLSVASQVNSKFETVERLESRVVSALHKSAKSHD